MFFNCDDGSYNYKGTYFYKGFTGEFKSDPVQKIHCGRATNPEYNDGKDFVTFQSKTLKETRAAFEESVDDYLDWTQNGDT